jgi:hypothetical protein
LLHGKTLLGLDTCVGGVAERLYARLGWTRAGVIPRYALYPDGTPCDSVIFWKALQASADHAEADDGGNTAPQP